MGITDVIVVGLKITHMEITQKDITYMEITLKDITYMEITQKDITFTIMGITQKDITLHSTTEMYRDRHCMKEKCAGYFVFEKFYSRKN